MKRTLAALLAAPLALGACGKSNHGSPSAKPSDDRTASTGQDNKPPEPEKAPTRPLGGSWGEGNVQYDFPGGSFSAIATTSGLQVVFDHAPKGTRYRLGDKAGVISEGYASVAVPFPVDLAKLPIAGAITMGAHVDPRMSLHLLLPDGSGGDVALQPVDVSELISSTLKTNLGKALELPGEAPDASPKDSLVYVSSTPRVFGKNGTVADVDFLASGIALPETRGTRSCEFTNESTGKAMTLTMNLHPWKVTLYERRTGKVLDTRTFAPSEECPMFSMTTNGQTTIDNPGNDDAAAAWLSERTGLDEIPMDQLVQL